MSFDWPLILTYHHLHATQHSRYVVSVSRFERQLSTMLDEGFTPLTLEQAIAAGPFGDSPARPKTFTITFDDALASFGEYAYPVLERLGLTDKTTMFVPTKYVGTDNAWRSTPTLLQRLMPWGETEEPLMGWELIGELADAGVSMQSHGHAHLPMQRLSYEDALDDVQTSLTILSVHGIAARYLALPFGWHSEECKRAIRDAGIDAALSVKWGGHDRYEMRRIPIYGTDSTLTHRLKLSGRYFDAFDTLALLAGKKRYRR